jgi:hypothetical protein
MIGRVRLTCVRMMVGGVMMPCTGVGRWNSLARGMGQHRLARELGMPVQSAEE